MQPGPVDQGDLVRNEDHETRGGLRSLAIRAILRLDAHRMFGLWPMSYGVGVAEGGACCR